MRLLGLDYGDKNIGVAVSDGLNLTAQALTVLRRDNETVIKKPLRELAEILGRYDVEGIVLGYPKNMNNSEGERCEKTLLFKARLEKRFNLPVFLWDERLSTVGADRALAHLTKEKRDKVIDKMAAAFMLQGYLDCKRNAKKGEQLMNEIDGTNHEEEVYEAVTLTDDEGNDTEYLIIDTVEDGGVVYHLMIDSEDEESDAADAIIFKEAKKDEELVLQEIEDDAEFERIAALFEENDDDYTLEI